MFIEWAKAWSPDNSKGSVLEKVASKNEHMCGMLSFSGAEGNV